TETEIRRADGAQCRVGEEKLCLVRVPVVDAAEIESELAEGQPNAAVDVEFSGRRGRQLGAPAPQAGIELDFLGDVAARLDVAEHVGTAVGLRNAAEVIVALNAAADGKIEAGCGSGFNFVRRLRDDVGSKRGCTR